MKIQVLTLIGFLVMFMAMLDTSEGAFIQSKDLSLSRFFVDRGETEIPSNMRFSAAYLLGCCVAAAAVVSVSGGAPRVTGISPKSISDGGNVRVTISGRDEIQKQYQQNNFAQNQFNFGEDSHVGNRVWFVNDYHQYPCEVFPDGSNENMIQCYTSPEMTEGTYFVRVSVDGVPITGYNLCYGDPFNRYCSLYTRYYYRPRIYRIEPRTGPVGQIINIYGRLFTDLYGSTQSLASHGRTQAIQRVYVQGQNCELQDGDELYGITMLSYDYVHLRCKVTTPSVPANSRVSVVIDAPFGKSVPEPDAQHLSATGNSFMYQTYAEITSVHPSSGSMEGGQLITITGTGFDGYHTPEIHVGDGKCEVVSTTSTTVVCKTPPAMVSPANSSFVGNRGLRNYVYPDNYVQFNDLSELVDRTDYNPNMTFWSDGAFWCARDHDDPHRYCAGPPYTMEYHNVKTNGYFVPRISGTYRFAMICDDYSKFYVSNNSSRDGLTLDISCQVYTRNFIESERTHDLEAGKAYYIEYLSGDYRHDADTYIAAKLYTLGENTQDVEGKTVPETHTIEISSNVDSEKQLLTFSGLSTQEGTAEEQCVEVEFTDNDAEWRLGMYGVYTDMLNIDTTDMDLQAAIEDLPTIAPNKVSVTKEQLSNSTFRYNVTFISGQGDWPLMSKKEIGAVSVTIIGKVDGVPSLDKWRLHLNHEGSPLLSDMCSTLTPDDDLMEELVESLFSARCPSSLTDDNNDIGVLFYESYETTRSRDRAAEPLCGKASYKNPSLIYRDRSYQDITAGAFVCFGYRGTFINKIRFRIRTPTSHTHYYTSEEDFTFSSSETNEWFYTCIDILHLAQTKFRPGEASYELYDIEVYREAYHTIWVDEVVVSRKPTTMNTDLVMTDRRIPLPTRLNRAYVSHNVDAQTYQVTLSVFDCANSFELYRVFQAPQKEGSTGILSNSVTWGGATWPVNATIMVERLESASPPVTGTFQISHGETTIEVDPAISEFELETLLTTDLGLGQVKVTRSGSCYGYIYKLELPDFPDLPTVITANGSDLIGKDTALSKSYEEAHLFFNPIPGDMVATSERNPQVRAAFNDILSRCAGDCGYSWSPDLTPEVTAIHPTSGGSGTTVTLSGSGFSDNIEVMVGKAMCSVSSSGGSIVVCQLGAGEVGLHNIKVTVGGKGLATTSISPFSYNVASLDSVIPNVGSKAGSTLITLTGNGFDATSNVMMDGNACSIVTVRYDQITCRTPASTRNDSVTITVNLLDDTLATDLPGAYTYSDAATPTVSHVSPTQPSAAGGEILRIEGTNFNGASHVSVSLTDSGGNVISLEIIDSGTNDTSIAAELPSLAPGAYAITVAIAAIGNAEFGVPSTLTVVLEVNFLSNEIGSMEGGTRLELEGQGFGTNKTLLSVKTGDIDCRITELTPDTITCYTGRGSKTVVVDNSGTHPEKGLGYAWSPEVVNINAGDRVRFKWASPRFVEIPIRVQQVFGPHAEYNGTGFSSGAASSNGQYEHQFHEEGTYYFATEKLGFLRDHEMRGRINVGPKAGFSTNLAVTLGGQPAEISLSSPRVGTPPACEGLDTAITPCGDVFTGPTSDFTYQICSTPEVTSQNVVQGYIDTDIIISGTGFSGTACDNEVMIGDYTCVTTAQSTTQLTCKMDPLEEPDVGISFPCMVRINNRGYALDLSENNQFALLPSISSVTPEIGSVHGGTKLTISGAGFVGETHVTIAFSTCLIKTQSYTQIVCSTPPSAPSTPLQVEVTVTNSIGTVLPAKCLAANNCTFIYATGATPSLNAVVSPAHNLRDVSTDLVIDGGNLGDIVDNVKVMSGENICVVSAVTPTQVNCTLGAMPVGPHFLKVRVDGLGDGSSPGLSISADMVVTSISPPYGSIHGGQEVTITGVGFHVEAMETTVTINSRVCDIIGVTITEVKCTTRPSPPAVNATVGVTSNGVTDTNLVYTYDADISPTVSSISPDSGTAGDMVTIIGSGFLEGQSTVTIGGSVCGVSLASSNTTYILCALSPRSPGDAEVLIYVDGIGYSNNDVIFMYLLTNSGTVVPNEGSFGGGLQVNIGGSGFIPEAVATFCGVSGTTHESTVNNNLVVVVPSMEEYAGSGSVVCNVTITVGDVSMTIENGFTYSDPETPTISGISPSRGGTMGGTLLTINGNNFRTSGNDVSIDGVTCLVQSETTTMVVCMTGISNRTIKANVVLHNPGQGYAVPSNIEFYYVDVWSSIYTWGGLPPPTEGDFVVVKHGQTLLLDTDTEVMKMILIQGGELLFDDRDLTLRAENILIVDGGKLTVGTEEEPFQHQAVIEMHGKLRAKEIPIYGAKCLAVREGELNLHGKFVGMTWTRLAQTASAGANTIELEYGQSDWPVGGTIVIATTGDRHSQRETETHTIVSISADGRTITLNGTLEYTHLGVTEPLGGGHTLEMRAEVGLLTRNVKVIGSRDLQWADDIEACPDGFDTGEFATQTCFQGRFGDEVGSDQFGAQIMIHAPVKDTNAAVAKLSYIELSYVGQAFRLGRYPVHFHLNGDMEGSYVKGLSIHESFNRAVNIHGTHNILVEHTVIYNIMGGAFFLEDGIETGNRYYYNLALFVKASSSLLNDDITPAAFWATNPDNHYEHNAVAGGTHFGWWYRLKDHPEGPSTTSLICPRKVPLGTCNNNTVHSNGWFGLWTFEHYYPVVGGSCWGSEPEPAVFKRFIVWNCEKGLEFVNGGALQFDDCLLANNKLTGLEGKKSLNLGSDVPYSDRGPMLKNSVVAAYAPTYPHPGGGTRLGVTLPWTEGFSVVNTTFINFDKPTEVVFGMTSITGTCTELCGGYNYHVSGLQFINDANHLVTFRWHYDGVFVDLDGSLTGIVGGKVLSSTDTLDPSKCSVDPKFSHGAVSGSVCDASTSFARMSFNEPNIDSMLYKDVHMTNEFGTQVVPFASKRLTHKDGWTTVVELGQEYKMVWENIEHLVNISYNVGFYDMEAGGVIIRHNVSRRPDRVATNGAPMDIEDSQLTPLDINVHANGDFYYDENNNDVSYLVKGDTDEGKYLVEHFEPSAYRCYWPDCIPPPDPNTIPPVTERPDPYFLWSDNNTWPGMTLPAQDTDVTIDHGKWVVADMELPRIKTLTLKGFLEMEYQKIPGTDSYRNFTLEVDFIIILGGRLLAGWIDNRFFGNFEIILHGDLSVEEHYPVGGGPSVGIKAIAVYGGLDLHGRHRQVQSQLAETAAAGSTVIHVKTANLGWQVDEEIVIASTSYDAKQTETVRITAINGTEITVDPPLAYKHLGESITDESGKTHSLAAEVALLSRNIVVRGGSHSRMVELGLGGRVLVGSTIGQNPLDETVLLVGWARVSYTRFINMGQLGYTNSFDPRYAIAYVDTGVQSNVKPSFLKGNSFDDGFSPAIGLFGAHGISVQDNIMHKVVGGGMYVHGTEHVIERNLVALNLWSGDYNGRAEERNVAYESSYELTKARNCKVHHNIAAGYQRAGFSLAGELCVDVSSEEINWKGNRAHSGLFGVMMWTEDGISPVCFRVSGFTAWKNFDFGIFIQTPSDRIELEDNALIENGLGMWTHTFGPSSLSHIRREKSVLFKRGYVSGATEYFDCELDKLSGNANFRLSANARSWRTASGGMVGISMPNADGGDNGLPTHPFPGRMSYPTLDAKMNIEDTRFANFKLRQCSGADVNDVAITSNPSAHDLNHPVYISNAAVESSANKTNLVFFHSPSASKVNPSDCVDMECDGHKKSLLYDLDGSFFGTGSSRTVIDDAAVNWDGAPAFGIGDYRIPQVMLTYPNSTRFDPPNNKGLYRDGCVYQDSWKAWECDVTKYRMLVIESMDEDTEARRLSPVAVMARTPSGGYIDLLNGPQDHGWCSGYTCQRRISTFWAVVADGHTFDIYLTSTNPQHTRFYMLQAENTESVRLAVYYFSPQRLDVFSDGVYVYPTNGQIVDGTYTVLPSTQTPSEHLPELSLPSGQNYFDREWQLQYLIVRGTSVVDVIIKEAVIVSITLPPMTIDEFFGENIISNLATFLGIPANKIRIVNIISESGSRKKRNTDGTNIVIEIGDEPEEGTTTENVNNGDLDRVALTEVSRDIVDAFQQGRISEVFNVTVEGIGVVEPLPVPENSTTSEWANLANNFTSFFVSLDMPSFYNFTTRTIADKEQQPFPVQPSFTMYNSDGEVVTLLGSREDPWKIGATLNTSSSTNPDAELIGNTICIFRDGVCQFENLGISHSGSDYIIEYRVVDPMVNSYGSLTSYPISVEEAELTAAFTDVSEYCVTVNTSFSAVVEIRDYSSQRRIDDITWRGDNWMGTISVYTGAIDGLDGDLTQPFNNITGNVTFDELMFTEVGRYTLKVDVESRGYMFMGISDRIIVKPATEPVCEDFDECEAGTHSCDDNAECVDMYYGYNCTCYSGYAGNGTFCSDIDECEDNSHGCDENAMCMNTEGGYSCRCNPGYTGDGWTCTRMTTSRPRPPSKFSGTLCEKSTEFYGTCQMNNLPCPGGEYQDGLCRHPDNKGQIPSRPSLVYRSCCKQQFED